MDSSASCGESPNVLVQSDLPSRHEMKAGQCGDVYVLPAMNVASGSHAALPLSVALVPGVVVR
jgi:hypothetical protein